MKFITISMAFLLITLSGKAQLADSKWRSTMDVPDPLEVFLEFKKDTLHVKETMNGTIIESMTYKISNDSLKINKISGSSPCDNSTTGIYRFSIKENQLTLIPLSDDCEPRYHAFRSEPWIRENK